MLKICLTGGPCAGKTSSIAKIDWELSQRGYKVFIVPETATDIIPNGIRPGGKIPVKDFQRIIFMLQKAKEDAYAEAARFYNPDKVVIICDRGYMDQLAYISKEDFLDIAATEYGWNESNLMNAYDGVIHLVTAAKGTNCYTTENNTARRETAEEALALDDITMKAWVGHPHLRVIDNSTDFEGKIQRVLDEIFSMLGEPVPTEVERKFLIKKPDISTLQTVPMLEKTNIIQTYLISNEEGIERRIRQRGTKENGYAFYYTEKANLGDGKRTEREKKISERQYIEFLSEVDTSKHQILKNRHCFLYKDQYFELDTYPFDGEHAILEIELKNIDDKIELPPFVDVIKEVTDNMDYRNSSIAEKMALC